MWCMVIRASYVAFILSPFHLVRIYHRRGARRWKKVRRINGHAFVAKRFQVASYCDKCEDRIWGLGRQGYRCELCKIALHKRCCYFLKPDDICKGHPVSNCNSLSWQFIWLILARASMARRALNWVLCRKLQNVYCRHSSSCSSYPCELVWCKNFHISLVQLLTPPLPLHLQTFCGLDLHI